MEYITDHADFYLISKELEKIPAHKIILSSLTFFKEYFTLFPDVNKIDLLHFSSSAIYQMLNYLYMHLSSLNTGYASSVYLNCEGYRLFIFLNIKVENIYIDEEEVENLTEHFVHFDDDKPRITWDTYKSVMKNPEVLKNNNFFLLKKLGLGNIIRKGSCVTEECWDIIGEYIESLQENKRPFVLTRDYRDEYQYEIPTNWKYKHYISIYTNKS